jgi:2-oxoglutarate ferredoxin oxidoreductase subunit alpha
MSEFVGLAQFAEIPGVFWDITRMGPSTGLPTRTSQGDIMFIYNLGHGDSRQLCLLPADAAECFEFGWKAFDIAEEYQGPVFVASDLDLGMNMWMSDPFDYPDEPITRGKVLSAEDLDKFQEEHGEIWGRYKDVDNDAVPYRTIPGTDHPLAAYFTRGTGHDDMAVYSERADDWTRNMARLHRKFEDMREKLPQPVVDDRDAEIGIISFGTNDAAVEEARDRLEAQGIQTDYMRVRALPVAQSVYDFLFGHERVYIVENNFDGQLARILRMETNKDTSHVISLALGDSLPMTPGFVVNGIAEHEG